MFSNCEIKRQAAQPTMAVRTRTAMQDLPNVLGKLFCDIAAAIGEQGQQPMGPPYVAYFNMDVQALEIEVGFPVQKKLQPKGEVRPGAMPEGDVATCVYTGPYGEEMRPAYEAIMKLAADRKKTPTGVAYEIYFNSPEDTPPEKLQTQILMPLK